MKAISLLIVKDSMRTAWGLTTDDSDSVICDDFVKKYIGDYPPCSFCYLTLKINETGLVRIKKYSNKPTWCWTFNKYPKGSNNDWDSKEAYAMYVFLDKTIGKMSKSNNNISNFRVDVYMTDVEYTPDLKPELNEEESLKLIGETH